MYNIFCAIKKHTYVKSNLPVYTHNLFKKIKKKNKKKRIV